jgi:Reverse transcriptase (RNA-dependent DNA polymerase)/Endonuclease-reverse transcriptase
MVDTPINIASVNMRRRNAMTHALLHSSPVDHIILIQEPWFDRIGTARKDTAKDGVDILGGVASPGWEAHYPTVPEGGRAKVMAYTRKRSWEHTNSPSIFTTTTRRDLCAHPCIMILDLSFDDRTWRIINFYNDIRDQSALDALLAIDLDPIVPTLVVGDFNTHSRSWSPSDIRPSPWAEKLEEWAVGNLLVLANEPGTITRRGAEHERDSTIDLTWYNDAAIEEAAFGNWSLDWAGSLGSDHALTRVQGSLIRTARLPESDSQDLGYVIDEEKAAEWSRRFKDELGPPPPLPDQPTAEEVETLANCVHNALQNATAATMKRRRPFHPKGAPWWNADCAQVTESLRAAETREERKRHTALLRAAARKAKRKWADEVIGKSNLWEVATWRHGRRMNKVPPLRAGEMLAHEHAEISRILSDRFFVATPPPVPAQMVDDPPPRETRDLPPFDKEMVAELLANASNRSAPGASGQTWRLLKWAWNAAPDTIFDLVSGCVRAGHHPLIWRLAIVCAVPKPNRADYSLAKNFRPISLLECMGKLVEKLIARLLYREIINHDLIPTNQFGGRMASSTLDAGLTLLHDIQIAHAAGLRTGLLLFDIQGFFDNVNRDRLVQVLADLGFSQELVSWTRSFLAERTVRLKFNGCCDELGSSLSHVTLRTCT